MPVNSVQDLVAQRDAEREDAVKQGKLKTADDIINQSEKNKDTNFLKAQDEFLNSLDSTKKEKYKKLYNKSTVSPDVPAYSTLLNTMIEEGDTEAIKALLDDDWTKAINIALNKQNVASIFINTLLENQLRNANIIEALPVLSKWVVELGPRESTNPYLQFLQRFYEHNKTKLSNDNAVALNNLYSNRTLDFGDIAGTGPEKLGHIIFNGNLYDNTSSDIDFIVKAYEYLTANKVNFDAVKDNISKVSKAGADYLSKDEISNLDDNSAEKKKALRNAVIFKDPNNPTTSQINSRYVIEDLLSVGKNTTSEKSDDNIEDLTPEKFMDMLKKYKNLSQADRKKVNDAFSLMR